MNFAGKSALLALLALAGASGVHADPMPYAPIAMPLKDSGVDQKVRDSATLKFGRVRLNQAGYRTMDVALGTAMFYYVGTGLTFTVLDTATHASVGTGTLTDKGFKSGSSMEIKASNWAGLVAGGDTRYTLTSGQLGTTIASTETYEGTLPATLQEGHYYRVAVGKDTSVPFLVSNNIYGYVRDGVLKYFGIARSGDGPSWFHAPSHLKDGYLATPSNPGAYKGGWYDCGDHLKEPQTMAYALTALAMLTATMPTHDADHYGLNQSKTLQTDGIPDILAEAHFGAMFFLNSWKLNGRATPGMITGVGDFGKDHGWWGRPENQDAMTETGRGGYKERTVRSELGANTLGDVAAALAILSVRYRPYDAKWADTALMAAKSMYTYAKANLVVVSSPAYNGAGPDKVNANMALAATALLWATKDKSYLNDIAYDKTIGSQGATNSATGTPLPEVSSWLGGWMVMSNPNLTKGGANTDWANRHAEALYAFYKLILANPDSALSFGVSSEAERQNLITHTIAGVVQNLSSISGPSSGINIPLPNVDPQVGGGYAVRASSSWFTMYTQQEWVWNRYQMGNAAELYFYYDITKDLEAGLAGTTLTKYTWNRDQVRQLMVRMFDYQLGENPWDVSMIFGLGKKNFNHPHHRGANPEGRNTPGAAYQYHSPTGALYGSWNPENSNDANAGGQPDYNDYTHAEVCLDGAATTLMPAAGLAMDIPLNIPPHATVKVLDALDTTADIEVDLDKYGTVLLSYGLAQGTYTKTVKSDSAGVVFKFHLSNLTVGTQYFFNVVSTDLVGNDTTQDHWTNPVPDGTPYNFTTLSQIQGQSQITGVKVCNVTADSAEVMWYTPNGTYQSSVCYGTVPLVGSKTGGTTTCVMDADVSGHATKFHYVTIGGLQEQTTYYFKVASDGSNGVWDDNNGADYKFTTPVRMANFSVYAAQYDWSGMPALAINVVNNEARGYDSLTLRVYVRSKDTLALTGHFIGQPPRNVPVRFKDAVQTRYDICQAYDGAGFNHACSDSTWGGKSWGDLGSAAQLLQPVQMPDTYDPATGTYAYYFDLPLGPTMMIQGSRIRFDVIFADKQVDAKVPTTAETALLTWVRGFTPDQPGSPTDTGWYEQGPTGPETWHTWGMATSDWSFSAHSTAAGAPVDFVGIPNVGTQTDANRLIDALSDSVPMDPYITVYRKGEFVYGYSPSAIEQATKKTTWALNVKLNPPFDVPGATITLDQTKPTVYATGTADVFDALTPGAKGSVTDIWVNGVRLTPAQLATAAVKDPTTGLWNLNVPVKLGVGGNTVDITIFGGNGACPDTAITCASGCAFADMNYFIQFTKGKSTQSSMAIVDAADVAVGPLVTPDSSFVNIRVTDKDNNISITSKDKVQVTLTDLRTGLVSVLTLTETGDSSGIFESGALSVTGAPTAGKISVPRGDSVLVKYMDVNDSTDTSQAYLYAKAVWPTPVRAGLFRDCGGNYTVKALFDRAFATGGWDSARAVLKTGTDSIVDKVGAASISADAAGTTLTVTLPTGLTSGSLTGRLDIKESNGQGGWISNSIAIRDSVGPWIDSAKIVENLNGSATDSVFFWTSEPLSQVAVWPLIATRSGAVLSGATFSGATTAAIDAATNKYLVLLPTGKLLAGDSLRLDPNTAADLSGNAALSCPNAKRISLVSRPAPFSRAWISDANGDSRADQATLVFRKILVATDLPDSATVRFGTGNTAQTVKVSIAQATDSVLTLVLPSQYPFGTTTGSAADGSGTVTLWKSGEGTGPYALYDSVGPALLSAALHYGTSSDTLDLNFSESVRRAPGSGWLVAQPSLELGIIAAPDSLSSTHWRLPVNPGAVVPGDSVRPLPTEQWAENRSGRAVASAHPWIPVTGGERVPLGGWFRDANGDGAVDQATVVFAKAPKTRPGMMLLWPSVSGGFDTAVVDSGAWTLNPDGITATISVGPFAKGVTASPTTDLGRWISGGWWNFPMNDSVPPVLMSAQVRYAAKDGAPDTLHIRWSELVSWTEVGSLVRHLYQGIENPVSTQPGLVYDADSLGAGLLLDTGSIQLRRGDSVAFAAGTVSDRLGNAVPQITRWVPLQFGLRPARLDFKLQSYLEYLGWDLRPGPAAQVWVRGRGDDTWLFPDSTPVPDTLHTISATLTLNRILTGAAYIYDNAGIYVTSVDFSGVAAMAAQNKLPMDPSGMFQMKITWSGTTDKGALAGSGIYVMRLVLKDSSPDNPHGLPAIVNRVYKLGFKRATK